MNPRLNSYSRFSDILYENGVPIKVYRQKFPDVEELRAEAIEYLRRYELLYPDLVKPIQNTMYKTVKLFLGLETTGTKVNKHGIHQISGIFEVNDEVVETFNFKVAPNPKAQIEAEALAVAGVSEEQIKAYPPMGEVYRSLLNLLAKYVDKYDSKDKIWLVGFNNRGFDDLFFRAWFSQNGDKYFGSWFWADSLDALSLASQYLIKRRRTMPDFKLKTVARTLGIEIDESKLHDAEYDVHLTLQIYRIVTGLEYEL